MYFLEIFRYYGQVANAYDAIGFYNLVADKQVDDYVDDKSVVDFVSNNFCKNRFQIVFISSRNFLLMWQSSFCNLQEATNPHKIFETHMLTAFYT